MKDIKEIIQNYHAKPYGVKRRAAVLLPLIEVDGETHILYEVRSELIPQPGETSFPGGGVEADETPQEAAVRETMEELRIDPENIEIYGEIDYIVSGESMIYCFVGRIHNTRVEDIQPNEEVARVFTLPLTFLRKNQPKLYKLSMTQTDDEGNFPFHLIRNGKSYSFRNMEHHIPFYNLQEETLWGFTANLTDRFIRILTTSEYKMQ